MAMLTEDMKRVVREQRLGFYATVCEDGSPNLSPKGTTVVWDDEHIAFLHICSPGTVANLLGNPAVEINVVDPIVRKGYRFKGRASLNNDGDVFERGLALLRERGYDARRERVKTIVLVTVEHAAPLTSPAYEGGASEEEIAAKWEQHSTELAARRRARSSGDRDTARA